MTNKIINDNVMNDFISGKCYVASLNPAKLNAVKEVLSNFEVIGNKVDSGVGAQPLTDNETISGAYNRAKALPNNTLRIGLEAGITKHNDIYYLINWGVMISPEGQIFYAGGTRIPLPSGIVNRIIDEKMELSDVMDEHLKTSDIRSREGAIGYFTSNLVKRTDIFTHIVKLLYGQYLFSINK
jgi:inosine/xanthosine triphosphatase